MFPKVQLTSQHKFRSWLGTGQATSHYMNEKWHRLSTQICVTWPQWINNFEAPMTYVFTAVWLDRHHYTDVIITTMASQITSLTVVYSTVYADVDQRKHQSSASLAFVWGIHRDAENVSIWWRHHDDRPTGIPTGDSNHWQFKSCFRLTAKWISKLRITCGFPLHTNGQNGENFSVWWRHHDWRERELQYTFSIVMAIHYIILA